MSVVEWKSQNIELPGPFQPFKDIAVSAKQQQHVFPALIIKFLCVNLDKCRRPNNANGDSPYGLEMEGVGCWVS
jgi:hypothetical protein